MTKRDLSSIGIVPVMLVAISIALMWLSVQLQLGSERRQSDYAALQRAAMLNKSSNAGQMGTRSSQTLSSLALADAESAVLTVDLARTLASLLCLVALFQLVALARLGLKGRLRASTASPHAWQGSPHAMRSSTQPLPRERTVGS